MEGDQYELPVTGHPAFLALTLSFSDISINLLSSHKCKVLSHIKYVFIVKIWDEGIEATEISPEPIVSATSTLVKENNK